MHPRQASHVASWHFGDSFHEILSCSRSPSKIISAHHILKTGPSCGFCCEMLSYCRCASKTKSDVRDNIEPAEDLFIGLSPESFAACSQSKAAK